MSIKINERTYEFARRNLIELGYQDIVMGLRAVNDSQGRNVLRRLLLNIHALPNFRDSGSDERPVG